MKKVFFIIFILSALTEKASENPLLQYIPDITADGQWQVDFEPELYTPENLFEYINGEAEHYIDYHFKHMLTASWINVDDEAATLTVDIYDMQSSLNAFGLYSSFRYPNLTYEKIGTEAITSIYNIRFYKGRFFVQINAGSDKKFVTDKLYSTANAIAEKIPDLPVPSEITLLTDQNQIPRSLKYIPKGFMGQTIFENTMIAEYALPADTCQAFVIIFPDDQKADKAFQEYQNNILKRGKISELQQNKFLAEPAYQGKVLITRSGQYIFGVKEFKNLQESEKLLDEIVSSKQSIN